MNFYDPRLSQMKPPMMYTNRPPIEQSSTTTITDKETLEKNYQVAFEEIEALTKFLNTAEHKLSAIKTEFEKPSTYYVSPSTSSGTSPKGKIVANFADIDALSRVIGNANNKISTIKDQFNSRVQKNENILDIVESKIEEDSKVDDNDAESENKELDEKIEEDNRLHNTPVVSPLKKPIKRGYAKRSSSFDRDTKPMNISFEKPIFKRSTSLDKSKTKSKFESKSGTTRIPLLLKKSQEITETIKPSNKQDVTITKITIKKSDSRNSPEKKNRPERPCCSNQTFQVEKDKVKQRPPVCCPCIEKSTSSSRTQCNLSTPKSNVSSDELDDSNMTCSEVVEISHDGCKQSKNEPQTKKITCGISPKESSKLTVQHMPKVSIKRGLVLQQAPTIEIKPEETIIEKIPIRNIGYMELISKDMTNTRRYSEKIETNHKDEVVDNPEKIDAHEVADASKCNTEKIDHTPSKSGDDNEMLHKCLDENDETVEEKGDDKSKSALEDVPSINTLKTIQKFLEMKCDTICHNFQNNESSPDKPVEPHPEMNKTSSSCGDKNPSSTITNELKKTEPSCSVDNFNLNDHFQSSKLLLEKMKNILLEKKTPCPCDSNSKNVQTSEENDPTKYKLEKNIQTPEKIIASSVQSKSNVSFNLTNFGVEYSEDFDSESLSKSNNFVDISTQVSEIRSDEKSARKICSIETATSCHSIETNELGRNMNVNKHDGPDGKDVEAVENRCTNDKNQKTEDTRGKDGNADDSSIAKCSTDEDVGTKKMCKGMISQNIESNQSKNISKPKCCMNKIDLKNAPSHIRSQINDLKYKLLCECAMIKNQKCDETLGADGSPREENVMNENKCCVDDSNQTKTDNKQTQSTCKEDIKHTTESKKPTQIEANTQTEDADQNKPDLDKICPKHEDITDDRSETKSTEIKTDDFKTQPDERDDLKNQPACDQIQQDDNKNQRGDVQNTTVLSGIRCKNPEDAKQGLDDGYLIFECNCKGKSKIKGTYIQQSDSKLIPWECHCREEEKGVEQKPGVECRCGKTDQPVLSADDKKVPKKKCKSKCCISKCKRRHKYCDHKQELDVKAKDSKGKCLCPDGNSDSKSDRRSDTSDNTVGSKRNTGSKCSKRSKLDRFKRVKCECPNCLKLFQHLDDPLNQQPVVTDLKNKHVHYSCECLSHYGHRQNCSAYSISKRSSCCKYWKYSKNEPGRSMDSICSSNRDYDNQCQSTFNYDYFPPCYSGTHQDHQDHDKKKQNKEKKSSKKCCKSKKKDNKNEYDSSSCSERDPKNKHKRIKSGSDFYMQSIEYFMNRCQVDGTRTASIKPIDSSSSKSDTTDELENDFKKPTAVTKSTDKRVRFPSATLSSTIPDVHKPKKTNRRELKQNSSELLCVIDMDEYKTDTAKPGTSIINETIADNHTIYTRPRTNAGDDKFNRYRPCDCKFDDVSKTSISTQPFNPYCPDQNPSSDTLRSQNLNKYELNCPIDEEDVDNIRPILKNLNAYRTEPCLQIEQSNNELLVLKKYKTNDTSSSSTITEVCDCSVSLGEVHACKGSNVKKTKRSCYYKRHAEELLERDTGDDVVVINKIPNFYNDNVVRYRYATVWNAECDDDQTPSQCTLTETIDKN